MSKYILIFAVFGQNLQALNMKTCVHLCVWLL